MESGYFVTEVTKVTLEKHIFFLLELVGANHVDHLTDVSLLGM
jgi:hypothetical protein